MLGTIFSERNLVFCNHSVLMSGDKIMLNSKMSCGKPFQMFSLLNKEIRSSTMTYGCKVHSLDVHVHLAILYIISVILEIF